MLRDLNVKSFGNWQNRLLRNIVHYATFAQLD